MSTRVQILAAGGVLTAVFLGIGFALFGASEDLLLNLISEAAGVTAGGLVMYGLLEAYIGFRKRQEWTAVREELFSRIHWELKFCSLACSQSQVGALVELLVKSFEHS
jgi:hypothetical protein